MEHLRNMFNPLYQMTGTELSAKLGLYIKEKRLRHGMTQEELAQKVGISRWQLVKIEKDGKTSVLTLLSIARVFNLLNEFFATFETQQLTPSEEFKLEEKRHKMINKKPKRIRKNG